MDAGRSTFGFYIACVAVCKVIPVDRMVACGLVPGCAKEEIEDGNNSCVTRSS